MFLILNRLRGTNGVWSKFNGMLLAYVFYALTNNHYIALSVGSLYVLCECFKWNLTANWVNDLSVARINLNYARKHSFYRGLIWGLFLISLVFVLPIWLVVLSVLLWGMAFPLAVEIGYYTSKKFHFSKYGFNMGGTWEHQEVWYGLMQDIVLIYLIVYICQ